MINKQKSHSATAKGLGIVWLPLLVSFRTFKGDIVIDNTMLNQLVFQ